MSPAKTPDRRAWVRDTLSPPDWIVPLPAGTVDELEAVVHRLRREPLPMLLLSPSQFDLNNRLFAHSRTPFRDADEPDRKRHLIRLWNRDQGRQSFHA
jgi:hypothetical protein